LGLLVALGSTACPAKTSHSAVEITCPANLEVGESATLQAHATNDVDGTFRWTVSPDGAMGEFAGVGTTVLEKPPEPATRLSLVRFTALAAGTAGIGVAVHVEGEASTVVLRKAACPIVVVAPAPPPQTGTTTGPATTGATTGPTTEPESPSPLPTVDACSLLTAAEVGDVLGGPATRTPGRSEPGFAQCSYDAGGSGRVDLTDRALREGDESRASAAFDDNRQREHGTPITGIGDEAFLGDNGYEARLGTVLVRMVVTVFSQPGGPTPPSDQDLQSLLATAVSRISS
jgi:hypothetical protein